MDIWQTRHNSERWLKNELSPLAEQLELGFALIDESIRFLNKVSDSEKSSFEGKFARICGVTTAKGRNLLLACYSLSLDALAQESGALLRPLIEVVELLKYFREDPTRTEQAIDRTLPSAGSVGKAINGSFQSLRNHLNQGASHFGFRFHAVSHLVDYETSRLRSVQTHSLEVFKRNLSLLSLFQTFLLFESVSCLSKTKIDYNNLADRSDDWKKNCDEVFHYDIFRAE